MNAFLKLIACMVLGAASFLWFTSRDSGSKFVDVSTISNLPVENTGDSGAPPTTVRTFSPNRTVLGTKTIETAVLSRQSDLPLETFASERINSVAAVGARVERVRQIQVALKRSGCYWGRIDGDWGLGSQSAMRRFLRALNSSLPVEEPDELVLRAVQTNSLQGCMPGNASGREVVAGIAPPELDPPATVPAGPAQQPGLNPLPGRMSVGAPVEAYEPRARTVRKTTTRKARKRRGSAHDTSWARHAFRQDD
ncbi:MAG: hypothetical protein RLZ98_1412 [Pseudomonadota bacterium]|jgi:peptidoglycan hydrolase-like protein with peptidoglycan-binding domain